VTAGRRCLLRAAALAVAALALAAAVLYARPGWAAAVVRWTALVAAGARTGVVEVRGVRMAYAELGRGQPVVLVHGLGGESLSLLPLARELARRDYRAVLFDLPGCGGSSRPAAPLEIDAAGEFVLDAADVLRLGERPALVGHSLGGWIVAWQALEHPERCGPVVLSAAAGLAFDPPPLNVLTPRTVGEGRRNIELLFARPPWIPRPLLWLIVHRPRPSNSDLLRSALSGRFLLDGLLGGFSRPALVVSGEVDRVVPVEAGAEMARQIGAPHVVVRGAGHMLIWEQPKEVADAVDEFLRQTSPDETEQ